MPPPKAVLVTEVTTQVKLFVPVMDAVGGVLSTVTTTASVAVQPVTVSVMVKV